MYPQFFGVTTLRILTNLRSKPGAHRHDGERGGDDGSGPVPKTTLSCVLLADRHHGLTEGVRGLLATAFGSVVMVADEASLIEGAARLQPDVAIVDLSLAPDSHLNWLQTIRRSCPALKVIVLSVHDERSVREAAMRAGADAFVLKRAIATDLLSTVDAVRRGAGMAAPPEDRSRP
jgi:DNA-binding NarL/FixJ family response regulator